MVGFKQKVNTPKEKEHFHSKINLKPIFILPIKIYQWCISPYLGQNCRHSPTCSQYAIEAIKEWGVVKGSFMGVKRVSQCHPWGKFGYDPVPKRDLPIKKNKFSN